MTMAKLATNAGQIRREEFDALREKFNIIQDWAIRRFGEPALLEDNTVVRESVVPEAVYVPTPTSQAPEAASTMAK